MTNVDRRTEPLHVSKILVELQLHDDVLEVPALTDSDHEDQKHKADGVPQQTGLVLNHTMNLRLRSLAWWTQSPTYEQQYNSISVFLVSCFNFSFSISLVD